MHHRAALDYARGEGATSCPEAAELERAVTARLGYSPWVEEPEVILNAVVSGGPGAFTLHLAMLDADGTVAGQRDLASTSMDCREIAEALVLDLCMAIDPRAALQPASAPPPPPAVTTPPPRRRPRWVPSPPPPEMRGIEWRHSGWAHAVLSWGTAPGVSSGMQVGTALGWGPFQSGVEARLLAPSLLPVPGGRVGTALVAATWLPCVRQGWLLACGAATAGGLVAMGDGLHQARRVTRPYAALGTRLELEIPLVAAVALRTGLEASLSLNRVRLSDSVTGATYWAMPPGSLGFFVGLGTGWP